MARATKIKTLTVRINDDDTFGLTINYRNMHSGIYITTEQARTLARVFSRLALSFWAEVDGAVNSVKWEGDEGETDSAGVDG